MKILFVNPVGAIGGAERALLTMLAALRTAQPNLQLHLIVGSDGLLVEQAQNLGVQVKVLKLPEAASKLGEAGLKGYPKVIGQLQLLFGLAIASPSLWQYLRQLRRSLDEIQPDLIHSNGIKTHLLTTLARLTIRGRKQDAEYMPHAPCPMSHAPCPMPSSLRDVPIIWHIHDFYGARPFMARFLQLVSNGISCAIAISHAVAQDAKATIPSLPIEVIYNAIDINYFCPSSSPPVPLSPSQSPLAVGLVATFARWKGHDIFLEAAAMVMRSRPDLNVRFYIVGEPIYQTRQSQFSLAELRTKAAQLEIEHKVDFLGFQPDIADIYRRLDIVVHASTQPEPFGLAIAEAMACGKPVIVSQAGGAAELFTHNYDAFGVPPGDVTALASAIKSLLDSPAQRQHLAENARQTICQRFNYTSLGEQILAVYRKVLMGNGEWGMGIAVSNRL